MPDPAFDEGVEAADLSWCTEDSCPYPYMSRQQAKWLAGFRSARKAEGLQSPEKGDDQ